MGGPQATLRLGLVGCGRLAELGYAPAAALVAGARIVAVADPDEGRRRLLAAACEVPGRSRYASAGELAAAGGVDAVVVSCPVDEHLTAARAVTAAGLPALVEKPPAADAAGARLLAALDPVPWIGFNRRFTLGRELPLGGGGPAGPRADGRAAGRIGRLGDNEGSELRIDGLMHYRRRSWQPLGGLGDAWLDLGPHLLDLALLAAGRPLRVTAARLEGDRAEVELRGRSCRVHLRCATDRPHRERFRVRASGATAAGTLTDRRAGGPRGLLRVPGRPHPLVRSLAEQLTAFVAAVRAGERAAARPAVAAHAAPTRPASAADGVAVMELLDAARACAGPPVAPASSALAGPASSPAAPSSPSSPSPDRAAS